MRYVLGALLALLPLPASAGGFYCTDTCTIDPVSQESCSSLGMGCNPFSHLCAPCVDDTYCAPSGTCLNQQCMGNMCQPPVDGGVADAETDAGDAEPNDGGDGGDGGDAEADASFDAGDVGVEDLGTRDLGFRDATDPTMRLPGARGGPNNNTEEFDDGGCGCHATTRARSDAIGVLIGLALLAGYRYRKCWRGVRVPGGKLRSL